MTTEGYFNPDIIHLVSNGDILFEISKFNLDGRPALVFARIIAGFVIIG